MVRRVFTFHIVCSRTSTRCCGKGDFSDRTKETEVMVSVSFHVNVNGYHLIYFVFLSLVLCLSLSITMEEYFRGGFMKQ
jgi:hypothetical protein